LFEQWGWGRRAFGSGHFWADTLAVRALPAVLGWQVRLFVVLDQATLAVPLDAFASCYSHVSAEGQVRVVAEVLTDGASRGQVLLAVLLSLDRERLGSLVKLQDAHASQWTVACRAFVFAVTGVDGFGFFVANPQKGCQSWRNGNHVWSLDGMEWQSVLTLL